MLPETRDATCTYTLQGITNVAEVQSADTLVNKSSRELLSQNNQQLKPRMAAACQSEHLIRQTEAYARACQV